MKQNRLIGTLKFIVIFGLGATIIYYSRLLILSLQQIANSVATLEYIRRREDSAHIFG